MQNCSDQNVVSRECVKRVKIIREGRSRLNQRGMTLIELLFAVALIPIVGVTLYGIVMASNRLASVSSVYGLQNEGAMQVLRTVGRELGESSSLLSPVRCDIDETGGIDNSSIVTFQIPVDWDNDGDVVDATSRQSLEWGAYDNVGQTSDGTNGGWVRYQLVAGAEEIQGNQLVRQVLDVGQAEVAGLTRTLISNVSTFTVSQNQDRVTITLGIQQEDAFGREQTATFEQQVYLRNSTT